MYIRQQNRPYTQIGSVFSLTVVEQVYLAHSGQLTDETVPTLHSRERRAR